MWKGFASPKLRYKLILRPVVNPSSSLLVGSQVLSKALPKLMATEGKDICSSPPQSMVWGQQPQQPEAASARSVEEALAAMARDTWGWKLGPLRPPHVPTHGSMNSAERRSSRNKRVLCAPANLVSKPSKRSDGSNIWL